MFESGTLPIVKVRLTMGLRVVTGQRTRERVPGFPLTVVSDWVLVVEESWSVMAALRVQKVSYEQGRHTRKKILE